MSETMSRKCHDEAFKSIEKLPAGGEDESWPSNLIRAPSLPPRKDTKDGNPDKSSSSNAKMDPKIEEIQDEESEFSMGKLIRQASLTNSDSFPPSRRVAKKPVPISSISRHGSIRKMDLSKLEVPEKVITTQRVMNQLKSQKSLNDLELYQELQGFKDLGLEPESPNGQPSSRPNDKKSTDDIKAQIKFWARAVASNARQES